MPDYATIPQPADCTNCYKIQTCLSSCAETQTSPQMIDKFESQRLLYYCIPLVQHVIASTNTTVGRAFAYTQQFQTGTELASRAFADLYIAWPVILISAGIALIAAFLYTWLSEKWAGFLVLFALFCVVAGGVMTSYALLKYAKEADATQVSDRSRAMRAIGIAVAVATAIFVLVIFFLRERIYIAIEVIKEASSAILDMPWMVFFPVWPLLVGLGYIVFFIATTVLIASVWTGNPNAQLPPYIANQSPSPTGGTTYYDHAWNQQLKNAFAFVFFHLLWTIKFLEYFTFMVIAGAIAQWYFTPRNAAGEKQRGLENGIGRCPIVDACGRATRFHLGTVAFGSLIIAIIEFIRAVVKYIEETTTPKNGLPNRLQKAIFCLIQCCLYCVQCCMDKVNKNAFVWTAIWGDSYCTAACSSFRLIWSNLARVAAVSMVGAYIVFVGKLLVALVTTGIGGVIIYKQYNQTINSLVLPMVVIFVMAYMVASLFMMTLETTIDTVFLCFLVDEKYNKASGQMLASAGLQKVINAHSAKNEQVAARKMQLHDARSGGQSTVQGMTQAGSDSTGTKAVA